MTRFLRALWRFLGVGGAYGQFGPRLRVGGGPRRRSEVIIRGKRKDWVF